MVQNVDAQTRGTHVFTVIYILNNICIDYYFLAICFCVLNRSPAKSLQLWQARQVGGRQSFPVKQHAHRLGYSKVRACLFIHISCLAAVELFGEMLVVPVGRPPPLLP